MWDKVNRAKTSRRKADRRNGWEERQPFRLSPVIVGYYLSVKGRGQKQPARPLTGLRFNGNCGILLKSLNSILMV